MGNHHSVQQRDSRAPAGLKDSIVPVLCVDNDSAGSRFIKKMKEEIAGAKALRPKKGFKGWNEELNAMKSM